MAEPPHRYRFHPLERRGLLLGLQGTQLAVLAAGAVTAVVAGRAAPGAGGPVLAIIALAGAAILALYPKEGRPLAAWAPLVLKWLVRRSVGPRLTDGPLEGLSSHPATGHRGRQQRGADRVGPQGIQLLEVAQVPGLAPLGVIRDRHSGTWAAVIPVEGVAFPLLDAGDQVRRLDGWRTVLGTLARAGTPVQRLQWIQRSLPAPAAALMPTDPVLIPGPAGDSYRQSITGSAAAVRCYGAWLVLCVGDGRRGGGTGRRCVDQLAREVRLLDGQLRHADLRAGDPLDMAGVRRLIGAAHQTDRVRPVAGRVHPWPLATDEAWSVLRAGGTWHATYWISEWPPFEVSPDFLTPLLLGQVRRTAAVVMAPVPAERAIREVRAARTADVADEELRNRAGFLPSARRHREADGVARRESELADGHSEYRFSGYVTVTAEDRDILEAACVETEQAAQSASIQLLRLYGRQAEAYTWTLPLGRGLA